LTAAPENAQSLHMRNLTRGILLVVFAFALALAPVLQAAGDRFAAIAYSPKTGRWGYGANYPTKSEAIARARRECGRSDARTNWCRNAWIALAVSDESPGGWGSAWGETAAEARAAARRECLARNPDARVVVCVSAYE
jgi:serine/threonine-protein kinase